MSQYDSTEGIKRNKFTVLFKLNEGQVERIGKHYKGNRGNTFHRYPIQADMFQVDKASDEGVETMNSSIPKLTQLYGCYLADGVIQNINEDMEKL